MGLPTNSSTWVESFWTNVHHHSVRDVPLSLRSFFSLLLPVISAYYVTALLVLFPRTLWWRISLLPVSVYTACRAAIKLDVNWLEHDRLRFLNQGLVIVMMGIAMRCVVWTYSQTPFQRAVRPDHKAQNKALDAFDLIFGLRGCDWTWCKGLYVPIERRPVSSTPAFLALTSLSHFSHLFLFDLCHYSIQRLSPSTIGSPAGGTIIDRTMPFIPRYLRASFISLNAGFCVYAAMQATYDLFTICGILLLDQSPRQWPPLFHHPWLATSLHNFWTHRWHQIFRDSFIGIGYKALYPLFGRIGGVLGAFIVSGVLHHAGLWGMGRGGEFWKVCGSFFMMGVGLVLEYSFKKLTGNRVGGWIGRLWTFAWVLGWGHLLVDAWSEKGLIGGMFVPEPYRFGKYAIQRLFAEPSS